MAVTKQYQMLMNLKKSVEIDRPAVLLQYIRSIVIPEKQTVTMASSSWMIELFKPWISKEFA